MVNRCMEVAVRAIEIINNTRAGIVIFFWSKKRERAIGGQIQVPDTLTYGAVPKTCVVFIVFLFCKYTLMNVLVFSLFIS